MYTISVTEIMKKVKPHPVEFPILLQCQLTIHLLKKKRITGVNLLASDSPLGQQSKEERIFYDLDDEGIIIRGVAVLQKFHEFFFSDGGPGHVKQMFILFHQALG